jgi:HAD superfamily hydrolase (TIGR01459 family)
MSDESANAVTPRHISLIVKPVAGLSGTQKGPHMTPPILTHAGDLLARYDVIFCDVWGVVHDGLNAYPLACAALTRFRAGGGTVVLVSNAPVPKERVAAMLDQRTVPRDAWDEIVSSGDIALAHVAEAGYGALHCIGPRDRDQALFAKLPGHPAALDVADSIICTGLTDDLNETAESYRPLLEVALARRLPFVCANPDLVVDVGGKHYICAGAIADLYEQMGGEVYWAGKPHPNAYGTALAVAERLRGGRVAKSRILAIGDAIRTDLKAAQGAGVDALFIVGGIHRYDGMVGAVVDPARLATLFTAAPIPAVGAMGYLAW